MTGKVRRRDFPIVIASVAKQSTSLREQQGVDGRVKPGHDASVASIETWNAPAFDPPKMKHPPFIPAKAGIQ
jgi:hypothetical protein